MAKHLDIGTEDSKQLQAVGRALSSEHRINILKLLYYHSLNINEISEALGLPASSTAMHIRVLEVAGLINTENQPGTRGTMKLCSRKKDSILIRLSAEAENVSALSSFSIPIGQFTSCRAVPTCGMAGKDDYMINEDSPSLFYSPERVGAQLLWSSGGYFEYQLPKPEASAGVIESITISAEMCSEAPNYREDWKSDITMWINGVECCTWQSPGDFGARRGRLNPGWWKSGNSQYGLLTKWQVGSDGCFVNDVRASDVTLADLKLDARDSIQVRFGNKEDAEYAGGINLFGRHFGDYEQDIVVIIEHNKAPRTM